MNKAVPQAQRCAVDVYFVPSELAAPDESQLPSPDVAIIVDVIRATTMLVIFFERGASRVYLAGTLDEARVAAELFPARERPLLCGERGGLAPEGFDYGNSPTEFSRLDQTGKEIIFSTTNGTKALRAAAGIPLVLAGCFLNARAVCVQALAAAGQGSGTIAIICAGREGRFASDDSGCAGYLVEVLQELSNETLLIKEGAQSAVRLFRSLPLIHDLLWHSAAGQAIVQVGLEADIAYCAQVSKSLIVPRLVGENNGLPGGLLLMARGG